MACAGAKQTTVPSQILPPNVVVLVRFFGPFGAFVVWTFGRFGPLSLWPFGLWP